MFLLGMGCALYQVGPETDEEKALIRQKQEEAIDWNARYQTLCDTPVSTSEELAAKKVALGNIVTSFVQATRRCAALGGLVVQC